MEPLYQRLAERVNRWRSDDYPSERFPAVSETLSWNRLEETGELRFLSDDDLVRDFKLHALRETLALDSAADPF